MPLTLFHQPLNIIFFSRYHLYEFRAAHGLMKVPKPHWSRFPSTWTWSVACMWQQWGLPQLTLLGKSLNTIRYAEKSPYQQSACDLTPTLTSQVGAYSPGGLFYAHYDVIGLVKLCWFIWNDQQLTSQFTLCLIPGYSERILCWRKNCDNHALCKSD